MPASSYIVLSLVILVIVSGLLFVIPRQEKRLTPLASLAFAFILAGIVFGEDRRIGYALLAAGLIMAVVDIVRKAKEGQAPEQ